MCKKRPRLGGQSYHHVTIRTAQGIFWLEGIEVKKIFKDLVAEYTVIYYVEALAQSCMSNHTHLVLEVNHPEINKEDIKKRYELAQTHLVKPRAYREEMAEHLHKKYTNISWFMWEINSRMGKCFNKLKGTKGHIWGARVERDPGQKS